MFDLKPLRHTSTLPFSTGTTPAMPSCRLCPKSGSKIRVVASATMNLCGCPNMRSLTQLRRHEWLLFPVRAHVDLVAAAAAPHFTRTESRHLGLGRVARHVDQRGVEARILEAIADQVLHAQLAHVAERQSAGRMGAWESSVEPSVPCFGLGDGIIPQGLEVGAVGVVVERLPNALHGEKSFGLAVPGHCFADLSCEIAKLLLNFTDYTDCGKTKPCQDRDGLFSYFKITLGITHRYSPSDVIKRQALG